MSIAANQKIREIREAEGLSRSQFEQEAGLGKRSLERIENQGNDIGTSITQAICKRWPEYTLWLMTDMVHVDAGQISPEIKQQQINLEQAQKAG